MSDKKVTGKDLERLIERTFGTPPRGKTSNIEIDSETMKTMGLKSPKPALNRIINIAMLDKKPDQISQEDLRKAYRSLAGGTLKQAKETAASLKALTAFSKKAEEEKKHDINLYFSIIRRSKEDKNSFKELFFDKKYLIEPPSKEEISKHLIVWDRKDDTPDVGNFNVELQDKQDVFDFDLRNYAADEGKYPPQLASVFGLLFEGETNFIKRLGKIVDFSNNVISSLGEGDAADTAKKSLKDLGLQKYMQNLMVLDYLTTIAKNLDSGSGAYHFEAFLALVAGGKVTGKATEDGLMGALDFEMGNKVKGSAKYYSKFAGLKQSAKGFSLDEVVHYIIAIKKGEGQQGEANPMKIMELNLHWIIIECIEKNKAKARFKYYDPLGVAMAVDPKLTDKATFGGNAFERNSFIGTIKLVSTDTTDFSKLAKNVAEKLEGNYKKVAIKTQEAVKNSIEAKEGITSYASSGTLQAGNAAVDAIVNLREKAKELIDLLGSSKDKKSKDEESKYDKVDTSKLNESKQITAEHLKKLIQESFK